RVENGPRHGSPKAIIVRGWRQYLDLVIDLLDALDILHRFLRFVLERRRSYISEESHVVAVDLVREMVEQSEIRQHDQLVPYLLDDPLFRLRGWSSAASGGGRALSHGQSSQQQDRE